MNKAALTGLPRVLFYLELAESDVVWALQHETPAHVQAAIAERKRWIRRLAKRVRRMKPEFDR